MSGTMNQAIEKFSWWNSLRHGGLLLDAARLSEVVREPQKLSSYEQDRLRRELANFVDAPDVKRGEFVKYMMGSLCGFERTTGEWYRGSEVSKDWSRTAITGETIRPAHLWIGKRGAMLPVFIDKEKRLGIGRGVRVIGHALQWMRKTSNRLSIVTNGDQWRILYAGLDYEAFAEWDQRQWFSEGEPSTELKGFLSLVHPDLFTPPDEDAGCQLLAAINDSRKGQAELSQVLGERVRQAAELLIQGHAQAFEGHLDSFTPQELYRAGVRMIMRLVVVLFAESREALLPRDNPVYHMSYSLQGLRDQLERINPLRLRNNYAAYPRLISLCKLVYEGCSHEALLVPTYGGQLFEAGDLESADGLSRALAVLEQGCYEHDVMNDQQVRNILDLLSRTKIKIRQGRQSTWIPAPVDFSSLDSEYIGILYEGLLDFELRQASADNPIIFLAVGNQPALPLATLEAMDDKALKNLLEKMKDTSSGSDEEEEADEETSDDDNEPTALAAGNEASSDDDQSGETDDASDDSDEGTVDDARHTARVRAEAWAQRAIKVGNLVTKPRGAMTDEKKLQYQAALDRKAKQIVTKVVLPGEWYLVRWGGTRKGSGTFYTRPQLAIPTVHRTLRPLAYDPPAFADKTSNQLTFPSGRVASNATGEGAIPEISVAAEKTPEFDKDVAIDPPESYASRSAATPGESGDVGTSDLVNLNYDAPVEDWIPKRPEEILNLKVCDPACGSGSFPLAALRFLTEALYNSLHHYNRIQYYSDRTVIDLIVDNATQRTLSGELLPCRPEDNDFEPRTKAVLRRYIVERCIYGVDLDPLAVELCRLSLWIETLDPRLPFTFLDHKIKCGNSLIGTWFDQFMHYPAMAWMREGGDKNHSNGVHYEKEAWTKAISSRVSDIKSQLIDQIDQQLYLNTGEDLNTVQTVHDDAERALEGIHRIGIHEADRRAQEYHRLVESDKFKHAKFSLNLWCAIWFWPPQQLEHCPLVTEFYEGKLSDEAKRIVESLQAQLRFFHWQLEFPDVFSTATDGFDAVLGNPPWDIAKPNSKEFFSALDPLYRSYGKQEAINKQKEQFATDAGIEQRWLEYNAQFRAQSNWVKNSGDPYGCSISTDSKGKQSQTLNIGGGGGGSFNRSVSRHEKWKDNREGQSGYSQNLEEVRGFHHQGGGDINLYKMFLEQGHAILNENGRMGFIVPSGIYSDHGTGNLRTLFLDHCRWQWLFGFENREKVFDIDSRFKFNPIIIQKGGRTDSIRTAFMRRDLADWEKGEQFITEYPRERVLQFSPKSKAILEIQSRRDLEVLEKIYSNGVLLGDDGPNGWGIKYATEFHMTNDSKLFPPRDKWEERGYRPDEYSRWLKGNWQDRTGDCPAPPGCKRVDIPEGILLSRDGQSWISEDAIDTDIFEGYIREGNRKKQVKMEGRSIVLPLYEGRMIGQFDFSEKGWVSGKGRSAVWREIDWKAKQIEPQFLMAAPVLQTALLHSFITEVRESQGERAVVVAEERLRSDSYLQAWNLTNYNRLAFMDVSSATNTRTMISSLLGLSPCGNKTPLLKTSHDLTSLSGVLNSLAFDYQFRNRLGGTTLNYFIVAEAAIPSRSDRARELQFVSTIARSLNCAGHLHAIWWLKSQPDVRLAWRNYWAVTPHERLRLRSINDAIVGAIYRFSEEDYCLALRETDFPADRIAKDEFASKLNPKGLWRVDKQLPPEHRLTILSIVAFHELQKHIASANDIAGGVSSFLSQNDGEGWQLPETLRLADYGLGHDERALEHQPVRECFGPRFYDWQLEQDAEESWRECHLHARNLLGPTGYQALLDEIAGKEPSDHLSAASVPATDERDIDPDDFELSADPIKKSRK
ncbi:MAG: hypothetical protein IT422_06000 [Pirellulaceae bacterium]|nr:hypothetical protein [Pirellulaceae bacterium]